MIAASVIAVAVCVTVYVFGYVVSCIRSAQHEREVKQARKDLKDAYKTHNLAAIIAAKHRRDRLLDK